MKNLTKAFVGTAAAAAMAVSAITPVLANDRHAPDKHNDKISAGEVIAGVAILGGIAAILASDKRGDRDYDRRYDRGYNNGHHGGHDNGYNSGYNGHYNGYRNPARQATKLCINSVEYGDRYNYKKVTDIRDIERTRYGYRVKGRLAVKDRGHGGHGYNRGYDDYDSGRFTCYVEHGKVVDVDYRGIKGY